MYRFYCYFFAQIINLIYQINLWRIYFHLENSSNVLCIYTCSCSNDSLLVKHSIIDAWIIHSACFRTSANWSQSWIRKYWLSSNIDEECSGGFCPHKFTHRSCPSFNLLTLGSVTYWKFVQSFSVTKHYCFSHIITRKILHCSVRTYYRKSDTQLVTSFYCCKYGRRVLKIHYFEIG